MLLIGKTLNVRCFYVKPKYTYINALAKIYITPSPYGLFAEVCGMKKKH